MLLGAQTTSMLAPEGPETAVVVAGWSRGAAHVPVASRGPLDGRGFVGRILRSGQPVRVDGFDDVDASSPRRRALGLRSALVGPSSSAAGSGRPGSFLGGACAPPRTDRGGRQSGGFRVRGDFYVTDTWVDGPVRFESVRPPAGALGIGEDGARAARRRRGQRSDATLPRVARAE